MTIENPKLYQEEIERQEIVEKITPYVPAVLAQSSPIIKTMEFDSKWVENNLNSIIKGFFDYFSGREDELSLPIDTAAIYNQLPPEAQNGQLELSGIAEYAAKVRNGQGNLVYFYQESTEIKALKNYGKYLRASRTADYILVVVLVLTVLLTILYLRREWIEILNFIGRPLFVDSIVILLVSWGGFWYYFRFIDLKIWTKLSFDWHFAVYSGMVNIFEKFLTYLTLFFISSAIFSLLLLLIYSLIKNNNSKPIQK